MFDFILEYFRLATSGFWSFVAVFVLTITASHYAESILISILHHRRESRKLKIKAAADRAVMEAFPPRRDV